ncbi:protein NO VEIN domain-containing protein [Promicromonospora sp. NPDC019610]|uniref:protein NO VEIN domain-containing protein n=1 Tax=Promicromonospora sp. NPDC019610 TaxID=3364405 RepID=UPI00378DD0FB
MEERAVALATKHLQNLGWRVVADRQKEGAGYDIEFTDGVRTMHLEVKGVQGPRLAFNPTGTVPEEVPPHVAVLPRAHGTLTISWPVTGRRV